MKLINCTSKDAKRYINFCKSVYKADLNYRDSLTSLLKSILYKKSVFCKDTEIAPVLVTDESGGGLAACMFIVARKLPDTLQIAFFEAKPDCREAVDLLLETAVSRCREKGLGKIVIGLNGHVNYGLGILADHFTETPCFGNSYNPEYYVNYFKREGIRESILTSYLTDMNRFNLDKEQKLLQRIHQNFTFRVADFQHLEREVGIYTALNNQCFTRHPFYFERTEEEDFELLSQFKLFIDGKNLLIAERDGEPVGFMLWYPDFNGLIPPGQEMGVGTYIKNKLFARRIKKFKIAEIGIVPEYQGSGVILGLFEKCMQLTKGRYEWCEAGWILDTNTRSKGFGVRWADMEYKHYKVFEIDVREELWQEI